jgi:Tfp pilus assembly protein FimT
MQGIETMHRKAFSLAELIVIVLIVGVMALIAVPRLNFSAVSKMKSETVARKIVTDLRRTRMMAISDAANNTNGYSLLMTGPSPYTGYQIKNLNTLAIVDTQTIAAGVNCTTTGGSEFKFGPLGNMLSGSGTQITVSGSGKISTIDITSATGMIKCTEN